MEQLLDWLINNLQALPSALLSALAGFAIMLETSLFLGLIVPGDTVVLIAAIGVSHLSGLAALFFAVLLGSFVGETAGFWIGRKFGDKIRNSKLGKRIPAHYWTLADDFVDRRGGLAVAISRFLPVLHSLVPVVSGASRMPYRVFIRWTLLACAIWAGLYIGVGFIANSSYQELKGTLKLGGIAVVVVVVAFTVGIHFAKKKLGAIAERMAQK